MASPSLPKSVLASPSQSATNEDSQMSPYSLIRYRANFNEIVHVNVLQCQQEAHKNRIKNLRKELDYLKVTSWKYEPIEKYIGQS